MRSPALDFITDMGDAIESLSSHFLAIPKKVGGSMMRPYRDVRFSKDKRPFKTNVGIQFRHFQAKDVHAPGFYLHIEPGMGAGGDNAFMQAKQVTARFYFGHLLPRAAACGAAATAGSETLMALTPEGDSEWSQT